MSKEFEVKVSLMCSCAPSLPLKLKSVSIESIICPSFHLISNLKHFLKTNKDSGRSSSYCHIQVRFIVQTLTKYHFAGRHRLANLYRIQNLIDTAFINTFITVSSYFTPYRHKPHGVIKLIGAILFIETSAFILTS